jgi:hypothetical protein
MHAQWVFRRNEKGEVVGTPLRCLDEDAIVAEPGILPMEECLSLLLREGESCGGKTHKRFVLRDGKIVGYIELSEEHPGAAVS